MSRTGVKSLVWLDVSARKAGIPYLEYNCMPVGELSDFIDFYAASEGAVKLSRRFDGGFIPEVR